jgi:hypothetical protein
LKISQKYSQKFFKNRQSEKSTEILFKSSLNANTVKPVYNELGYNEFPLITNHIVRTEHRSHELLHKMIGYNELAYNENPLLTNEFSKTDSINSIRI